MGPYITQRGLGRGAYIRTKWHFDPFSCVATVDMGLKDRAEGAAVPLWDGGAGSPSNTIWPGPKYIKWHLDPSSRLATTDMGQNLRAMPFCGH